MHSRLKGAHSSSDYYVLRHSIEARNALMDKTLGEGDAFTQGTVAEILDVVKATIAGEARARYEEVESELASVKKQALERQSRVRHRAMTYSKRITTAAKYGIIALFIIGAAVLFPWNLPSFGSAVSRYLGAAATFLIFIGGCFNLYLGGTVESIATTVEAELCVRIEGLMGGE